MHTRQHTAARCKMVGGASVLLSAPILLFSALSALSAAPKDARSTLSTGIGASHRPGANTAQHYIHLEPGTLQWRAAEASIYGGKFLRHYMAAHNIKGEFSAHLDINALPAREGAYSACLYSYQFLGEPKRRYNLPVIVTLHNGALKFAHNGEPYTSDGSDPYQSQKIENKPKLIYQ